MLETELEATADLRHFLEAIFQRYGYDLRGYALPSLRRRVAAAVGRAGLSDIGELERRSVADPTFFATVLGSLTVRVTEMFRDPCFFQAFRTRVVPILRTYPTFTIWHGGCATGEEAYSVAILLAEEGLFDRCQLYATDVSPHAVEQAKLAIYPQAAAAAFAANYRAAGGRHDPDRYLTRAYDRISLSAELRRNVFFFQHDLVGDHLFGEMEAIFCRNVLIYFGRDLRDRVLKRLGDGLRPRGFLCLGRSEQLGRAGQARFSDFAPAQRIYRRTS
jgi:chemotaxis protein methyltransferase CheR